MTIKPGTTVTLTTKAAGWYPSLAAKGPMTVVCAYSGPFGPSWVCRASDGSETAVRAADLQAASC